MTTGAGLDLQERDPTPALLVAGSALSRGELRERADHLIERFEDGRIRRALVSSDDPSYVLSAIDACDRAGVDLWIAHTNIPEEFIAEACEQFGIQLRIGDTDELSNTALRPSSDPVAPHVHMMTSGTTGRPKIAKHTLDSLLGRIRSNVRLSANREGRWLLTYQTTGFAGVQVLLTGVLSRGIIAVPEERTPAGFYAAAKAASVTQISGTPTFWRSFLMVVEPGVLQLRQITIGGEAVDQATLDRVKAAFPGARVTHIYASTEAGAVFAVHDGLAGFPAAWLDQPTQGVQLRLDDGFLQIKTPNVMRGYLTEKEQPLLDDGWLATADRCEVIGDRVKIIGRQDATINVGGSKVYPLAVETVLLDMPEVAEARVFGVPNPISGYLVGAEVVLHAGVEPEQARPAILARCRERLAGYQVPRVFKVVDAIAVRASGKKG